MGGDLIQTPQTRWIQGAYESVQRGNLITLGTTCTGNAVAERWSTFRKLRETSGYVVPTGKTLYISEVIFISDNNNHHWDLEDGTDDIGISSAVAPAGRVRISNPGALGVQMIGFNSLGIATTISLQFVIPAGRYPAMNIYNAALTIAAMLVGHEE